MSLVFSSSAEREAVWRPRFAAALPDLAFHTWPETGPADSVRYLVTWVPPEAFCERFPNLEAVFSVGAGVDQFDLSQIPERVRIVRMVEPGLVEGMVEYVLWAVLSCHRDMFRYARQQAARVWSEASNRPAATVRVGVMGTGALGAPVIARLAEAGYDVRCWSRRRHDAPGVRAFAGGAELGAFLGGTDVLVCLLPLTAATRGILDAHLFAALPRGAALVNCGRGGHMVQDDLLEALAQGRIGQAVLDVTEPEPLPAGHPFWTHPSVCLTPHIASASRLDLGADMVIANIARHRRGEAMIGEIDRVRGY